MTMQISGMVNFDPKDLVPVVRMVDEATVLSVNTAMLFRDAGVRLNYVPYRGGSGVFTAILGNHIDVATSSTNLYGASAGMRPVAVLAARRGQGMVKRRAEYQPIWEKNPWQ